MHIILAVTATAQISQKSRIVQSALSKGQARASASLKRDHLGNMSLASFHYEVFGKVQGVFFRACTAEEANNLGIVGWVRNTSSGSVEGEAHGPTAKLALFKDFLQHRGSPGSRIDRCEITREQKDLLELSYDDFTVRR
ncbi:Acylphosphatase-domain-containing protein [Coccomyxa subellipsoidea C-169]|uniref:Acylphosphatase n=1 Tax=Coccomyxa subellipsoidea (strain C-169) TaxID=574566 RepID=I0YNM5_COCSC|nr:Acylphosphatase-domain-containing protein [Coccomyxa subellipsoidea C-169]EIE19994.1 Acylphosphatase-domain-containing protein [Coccomyxa subellipsoidea C-169]|eukprot:XP_005644538.1 Acylphosphatase-domain-containing protein [Coccomyxa subellipsoidea C-169]